MEDVVIIHNGEEIRKTDSRASFTTRFIVNTLALGAASYLIADFHIVSLFYLFLAGFIFTILNSIIKPLVIFLMLPFLLLTLGIMYPLVNVVVLNILDFIMGDALTIEGIFNAIIVSVVVAIVNYAVTNLFK